MPEDDATSYADQLYNRITSAASGHKGARKQINLTQRAKDKQSQKEGKQPQQKNINTKPATGPAAAGTAVGGSGMDATAAGAATGPGMAVSGGGGGGSGAAPSGSMKQGGKVPRTAVYMLHKGETVVPASESKARETQAKDIAGRTKAAEVSEGKRTGAIRKGDVSEEEASKSAVGVLGYRNPENETNPKYAVEGLKGNVEKRMKEQGEAASGLSKTPATTVHIHPYSEVTETDAANIGPRSHR